MLASLHIKNFTIIDNLDIEFKNGMTVLTGETGAGKSIILDGLNLVLGERVTNNPIKPERERCEIAASFNINNLTQAKNWLINSELDDQNECIIRRTFNQNGKSTLTINGTPCTQQMVREFATLLLNIHGQHNQQNLLKREGQSELLDNYAKLNELKNTIKYIYHNLTKTTQELLNLTTHNQTIEQQTDFIKYQLAELDELNLQKTELDDLHTKYKQLNSAEEILQTCSDIIESSNTQNLITLQTKLNQFSDISPELKESNELLNSAIINLEELENLLNNYLSSADLDPSEQQKIETRLNKIHDIARKHKINPEELFNFTETLQNKLISLTNSEQKQQELSKKIEELKKDYLIHANDLTKKRTIAAKKLEKEITSQLKNLNMQHSLFEIAIFPNPEQKFSATGLEQIEFRISTNPGQPILPLNKIASGGELSRISLAIQVITATKDQTPTLIFDEVDSGVGGKTAEVVGNLLQSLGDKTQVISITHLSQIAAKAHNHFQVTKTVANNQTITTIKPLSQQERIQEIARMLGGINITEQTIAHATEMLSKS
ncbi:MAG: DNA repair protein RecN [Gammaproteobacteria bacterium]|nr:DNA repair protein RecN [Gammaproteobacteria bacterium]